MSTKQLKVVFYLYVLILAILTLTPGSAIPKVPDWGISWDKLVHFLIFAVLAILMIVAFKIRPAIKNLLLVVTLCALYGLLLETAQILVPGRFFSWPDMATNGLGAAVASVFWGLKMR